MSKEEKFKNDVQFFINKGLNVVSTHDQNYMITIETPLLCLVDYWSSTCLFIFRKTGSRGRYTKNLLKTIETLVSMEKDKEYHYIQMLKSQKAEPHGSLEKMAMAYLRKKGYEVLKL